MTRPCLPLLIAVALFACGGDKDTDASTGADGSTDAGADTDAETDTDTDTGTEVGDDDDDDCTNSILSLAPSAGEFDVFYRTDVVVTLAAEDPGATILVMDAAGGMVDGATSVEGTSVIWSGDPLVPSTDYDVTVTYECGDTMVSWSTSSTGTPTEVGVVGKVYSLDLSSGTWREPAGVGDLLATQLDAVELLLMPTAANAQITILGAPDDGTGNQQMCDPTLPFPTTDYDDPYFSIESPLLPLDLWGFVMDIENLVLSGAFSPSADQIEGVALSGKIDTRPLVEEIAPGGTDEAVCELVATFGVPCEPCTGGGDYCLSLWIADMIADELPGASALADRNNADIAADPGCDP